MKILNSKKFIDENIAFKIWLQNRNFSINTFSCPRCKLVFLFVFMNIPIVKFGIYVHKRIKASSMKLLYTKFLVWRFS